MHGFEINRFKKHLAFQQQLLVLKTPCVSAVTARFQNTLCFRKDRTVESWVEVDPLISLFSFDTSTDRFLLLQKQDNEALQSKHKLFSMFFVLRLRGVLWWYEMPKLIVLSIKQAVQFIENSLCLGSNASLRLRSLRYEINLLVGIDRLFKINKEVSCGLVDRSTHDLFIYFRQSTNTGRSIYFVST